MLSALGNRDERMRARSAVRVEAGLPPSPRLRRTAAARKERRLVRPAWGREYVATTNRDHDLDEELRDHVERQIEANIQGGMAPDEARRQALIQFGNVPLVKEDTRAVWTRVGFEQVLQDLRFGARILTRSPGLSATAAILIALVIGINTTIFSMVNGMVRRPAPGITAEDLVKIALADQPGNGYSAFPTISNTGSRPRRCGR